MYSWPPEHLLATLHRSVQHCRRVEHVSRHKENWKDWEGVERRRKETDKLMEMRLSSTPARHSEQHCTRGGQ